jgi:Flp pilus assembly protein TadD
MPSPRRAAQALAVTILLAGCGGRPPPDWGAPAPVPEAAAAAIGLDSALRLGEAAAAGGDMASAVRILQTAAANHPAAPAPRRALAEAYFRFGAYPEARQEWREFRALSGAPSDAEVGLGRVALATGDAASAEGHFRAALAADPGNVAALNGAAVAMDLRGRHAEARRLYDEALSRDPGNRSVMSNRALSAALAGNAAEAVRALDELARGPIRLPQASHNLALAYALDGKPQQAADILKAELSAGQAAETIAFYKTLRR